MSCCFVGHPDRSKGYTFYFLSLDTEIIEYLNAYFFRKVIAVRVPRSWTQNLKKNAELFMFHIYLDINAIESQPAIDSNNPIVDQHVEPNENTIEKISMD